MRYVCQKDPSRPERGGLSISATHLDDYITERVLHLLGHPRQSKNTESTTAVLRRIVNINARNGQLEEDRKARTITGGEFRAGLQAAEQQLVTAGRATALYAAPIGNPAALETWWHSMDTTDRRAVITTVIRKLTIAPGRPGRSFDPTRIRITYQP